MLQRLVSHDARQRQLAIADTVPDDSAAYDHPDRSKLKADKTVPTYVATLGGLPAKPSVVLGAMRSQKC